MVQKGVMSNTSRNLDYLQWRQNLRHKLYYNISSHWDASTCYLPGSSANICSV